MNNLNLLINDLHSEITPGKDKILSRFFKTGKGEYGEGDLFLGITVPSIRKIVAKYYNLIDLQEATKLVQSKFHEERLTGLLILVKKFQKGSTEIKEEICKTYLKSISEFINNWDLVDLTAPKIVGNYLLNKNRDILYKLAKSDDLWERRVAVLATFEFIYNKQADDCLKICEILLTDKHDLIHKATGWMLREIGKRVNQDILLEFLDKHYKEMPRTMLRYSIERLSPELKLKYMAK